MSKAGEHVWPAPSWPTSCQRWVLTSKHIRAACTHTRVRLGLTLPSPRHESPGQALMLGGAGQSPWAGTTKPVPPPEGGAGALVLSLSATPHIAILTTPAHSTGSTQHAAPGSTQHTAPGSTQHTARAAQSPGGLTTKHRLGASDLKADPAATGRRNSLSRHQWLSGREPCGQGGGGPEPQPQEGSLATQEAGAGIGPNTRQPHSRRRDIEPVIAASRHLGEACAEAPFRRRAD